MINRKMVFHLLNENRLNDEQFGIFVDMLDTSTQKLVLLHAGGDVAHVQLGLALRTYHKAKLSIVFSRHGHQV